MRGKKKKTNEIINVVELMMNGNKKRLGSLWSSERSAASLAMQSHHILFWSCRHWGSPRSPLLTIRTCHWIPFKKKNLPSFPPPLPFCFFFFCLFFSLLLHLPPASPPPPARFRRFSEDGNSLVANFIYHFPHFFPEDEELTRFWRYSWSGNTPLLPAYFLSFFLFLSFFFCSPALPPDSLSVDTIPDSAHANDLGGDGGAPFGFVAPSSFSSSFLVFFFFFPGWSRSGLASRSTLRNHGHGVSLGKQRPGQQGFTQTLIILSVISGGSPQLYTLLKLLSLIVQSPL